MAGAPVVAPSTATRRRLGVVKGGVTGMRAHGLMMGLPAAAAAAEADNEYQAELLAKGFREVYDSEISELAEGHYETWNVELRLDWA